MSVHNLVRDLAVRSLQCNIETRVWQTIVDVDFPHLAPFISRGDNLTPDKLKDMNETEVTILIMTGVLTNLNLNMTGFNIRLILTLYQAAVDVPMFDALLDLGYYKTLTYVITQYPLHQEWLSAIVTHFIAEPFTDPFHNGLLNLLLAWPDPNHLNYAGGITESKLNYIIHGIDNGSTTIFTLLIKYRPDLAVDLMDDNIFWAFLDVAGNTYLHLIESGSDVSAKLFTMICAKMPTLALVRNHDGVKATPSK